MLGSKELCMYQVPGTGIKNSSTTWYQVRYQYQVLS